MAIVLALGFVLGLAASFQRFRNRAYKLTLANALQTEPGFSYVKTVLGKLPFYISMRGEGDTCEWLNIIVSEIFPAFSGFLANLMAFAVEPVLDWAKPPGIKSMKFRRFTLGTRPARFTGARAVQFTRRAKDHVAIDLDFTFDSDAEIQVGAAGLRGGAGKDGLGPWALGGRRRAARSPMKQGRVCDAPLAPCVCSSRSRWARSRRSPWCATSR